jgi:sulfopropanediol 3-dehydrogenase
MTSSPFPGVTYVKAPERSSVSDNAPVETLVSEIIANVRAHGDKAVRDYSVRFDKAELDAFEVTDSERQSALAELDPQTRKDTEFAIANVRKFAEAQLATILPLEVETLPGVHMGHRVIPIERVGCYVPGGRYPLLSAPIMTIVPAKVAGVDEVIACLPPNAHKAMIAGCHLSGADRIFRIGGAQAIAAMAYGTESIRPVDVIVGPGNIYVTLAKREVSGVVGIEATAGPSELVVVADESAPPDFVAIDLMAQAEHGPNGAALLVTWSETLAEDVAAAIDRLLAESSRRADTEATLRSGGCIVLVDGPEQAMEVANIVAPEHLELMNADPAALVPLVRHAGAVFCGHFAPAAVGDYVAGVNHVLPTARTARFSSALRVANFCKHLHVVGLDEAALGRVAPYVAAFADTEGLEAHAKSVRMRGART